MTLPLSPLDAQGWNSPAALALARRGTLRRQAAQADAALTSYRARAHGFVFFLAQVGEGLSGPPRLVKADELAVEVYWRAPDRSKQVVQGWRDGRWLPTDISYHRDHLGIVTNDFGDMIRIGEGDEVRDVPHPLSPAGLGLYDYALGDSVTIRGAHGAIEVRSLTVRPRDFRRALVVGTLYLDARAAEVVRFRFSFTPPSYLDRQLEDISIALENTLVEQRWWLPYRQEVQIRRRTSWLDFPARGIIRGRWEIEDYALNLPVADSLFEGPAIAGLRVPDAADTVWGEPLSQAVAGVAAPVSQQDMDAVRAEVERIAGSRALDGLPGVRLAAGSLSDLLRVNRVEGLALGAGGSFGAGGRRLTVRPYVSYGTADHRVTGSVTATLGIGGTELSALASRRVRDLSDVPIIAPALNSLTAQESGDDHGDYVLLHSLLLGLSRRLDTRTRLTAESGLEDGISVSVSASPATGLYRPNPALGGGAVRVARVGLERVGAGIATSQTLGGRLSFEAGDGDRDYARGTLEAEWRRPLGRTTLASRVFVGAATDGAPPWRTFVLGGRGTLVGEPFRAFGGRTAALAHLEWRLEVPAPALPLGSYASTGRRAVVAPFLAGGWTDRALATLPWSETDGVRPVAGVALELFMRLIRIEAGVSLRDGHTGLTIDVNRDWWGLL